MRTRALLLTSLLAIGCSREPDSAPERAPSPQLGVEGLAAQRAKDQQLFDALVKSGSKMSEPHELEHHFLCEDRAAAAPVIAWGLAEGYQPGPVLVAVWEGSAYCHFELVKSTVPTLDNITSQSTAMLEAAARFDVDYDGWGCSVVE